MGAKEEYKARNAAREARQSEQEKAKQKGPWWFIHHDPVAKFTGWVAIFTLLLFVATGASVAVLYLTDHTLRDTLVANNRAWVWVDASVASDLTFEENGDAKITIAYKLTNNGPAPALNVGLDPRVAPLLFGIAEQSALKPNSHTGGFTLIEGSNALQKLRGECNEIAKYRERAVRHNFDFGEVIFPNRDVISAVTVTIPSAGIDEAVKRSHYKTITPQVRLCVTYGFAVDHKFRETGRIYDIHQIDAQSPGGVTQIDPAKGSVPRSALRMSPNFLGGSYAK